MPFQFSLKTKLLGLCALLSVVTVSVGLTGYFSMAKVSEEYHWIAIKTLPKIQHLDQMYLDYRRVRITLRTLGLPGISAAEAEGAINGAKEAIEDYEKHNKAYVELGMVAGQKELYDQLEISWGDFKKTGAEVISLYKSGTPEAHEKMVKIFFTDCPDKAKKYTATVDSLSEFHRNVATQTVAKAESTSETANITIISIVFGGTLFSIIFGFLFANSLSKTLNRIGEEISSSAEKTSSGGTQLAAASAQLSSGATEAAASLEETVASLEELSSMVKLNTANSQQANGLSQNSKDAAEKGAQEIEKLIVAMTDIAGGSKKIEEIISVIDDIAFQTNLLALNAAVEAARAGEQGKGFAVVAEAVRSLAQKSAEAAKDISSLIKDNVEKSVLGAGIAGSSGKVLQEILTSVKKVADLNGEIAAGSQEQAAGLEQISKAMNQLDQATQGNAASSEEVAASSEQMSKQAFTLADLVNDMQSLVNGSKAERHKEASPVARARTSSQPSHAKKSAPLKSVKSAGSNAIPFDSDEDNSSRKIGNVSGF